MTIEEAAQVLLSALVRIAPSEGAIAHLADHELVNLNTTAGALRQVRKALASAGPIVRQAYRAATEVVPEQPS